MLRTNKSAICAILVFALTPHWVFAQQNTVAAIVDRTTNQVSSFLKNFSDVRCLETVTQQKLSKTGHAQLTRRSMFDYFVLLQGSGDALTLDESRLPQEVGKEQKDTPLLLTNGFSTLFLIFHPYYRDGFRFSGGAIENINGQSLLRLHFSHIPGTRTPAALALRGREYPLDLSGNAWIDPASGMIVRLDAGLENDMRDIGLVSLSVSVDYAPIPLPGWNQVYRFPVQATVEVQSLRQRWRNIHRFTNYQRFMVGTQWHMADADTSAPDKAKQ